MHHAYSPSACRALVDEMEWAISQVDPRKMIQMGSFRINPDGSQSVKEVTFLFPNDPGFELLFFYLNFEIMYLF